MSGVEIVGLLLAVIPLFISAAEHYKDGIGLVKRALRKELFASQYKDELMQQQTLLSLYIRSVVGRTSLSPQLQSDLVENPESDAWQRPDVIKHISSELGSAHQRFFDILSRISKALVKQIKTYQDSGLDDDDEVLDQLKKLCLDATQAPKAHDKKHEIWNRIKFSWHSSERAAILAELKLCNTMLEKLSIAADRAKPYERKQQSRRVHIAFQHRDEIDRLFRILMNACKCQSTAPHDVGLRLQVCSDSTDAALESKFEMILIDSQDAICELFARITKCSGEQPPRAKKLRLMTPSISAPGSFDLPQTKNMKLLEDICKEVKLAHACKGCIQIFVDDKEEVYCMPTQRTSLTKHNVQQQQQQSSSQQLLSLNAVLSKLKLYDHKRWLHREKSILAIILAYSLLQLHDSPWMKQTQWNCNNIAFIDNSLSNASGPTKADTYFELRHPYTRSQAAMTRVQQPSTNAASGNAPSKAAVQRRNAHLHALGIMLLELYLGRSIEEDVIASGGNDHRSIAQDLLEEHADDMSMTAEYLKAVRFCLCPNPNPYSGSFSFEDKGFREIFYTEVIAMLEENLTSRFEVDEKIWSLS